MNKTKLFKHLTYFKNNKEQHINEPKICIIASLFNQNKIFDKYQL